MTHMENKKIKTEKDYIEELIKIYPAIDEKEMGRVVNDVTSIVTKYLKGGFRGVAFGTKSVILDGKRTKFKMTKTRSVRSHLRDKRKLQKMQEKAEANGTADKNK